MPAVSAGVASRSYDFMNTEPSFLSLARKWRPQTFADLVGHEYTARVLQNAVRQNRLHHAFLFTGTRGVGKTTLARIVAKMVNCRQTIDGAPCLKCDMCEQITAGRMLDVVELDAASHTQVDKMRELLESAKYMPSQGKCKVFIIDEVHMLSKSSFAAMLKTLEEPPDYIKFVLATTDPQKMPATIMSRCLCFALRPLERTQIAEQLAKILRAEQCDYEEAAITAIARLARGSMRDALSIMEQALSHGDGKLQTNAVRRIVGETDVNVVADILRAIARTDADAIANFARQLSADSAGFDSALSRLAALIYKIALCKVAPDAAADPEEAALIKDLSPSLTEEQLQTLYEIAVRGRQQLPWAPDEQTGFEMTLLRMTLFVPRAAESLPQPSSPPVTAAPATSKSPATKVAAAAPKNTAPQTPAPQDSAPADSVHADSSNTDSARVNIAPEMDSWKQIMAQLEGSAAALAEMCTLQEINADGMTLRADKSQENNIPNMLPELKSQLRRIFHAQFTININLGEDDAAAAARARELSETASARPFVRDVLANIPEARIIDASIELQQGKTS